ncbi:hypothetical protein GCM10009610_59320 [Pseudonocardia xinjiangensis]
MLATGLRIGEASAVTWDALDLDAGTVEVRGTVVRVKGVGLVLKWRTKSRSGFRTLELPRWAVEALRACQARVPANEWNTVFTAPLGGLRDPSNTQADLRVVVAAAGYPWVTSHVYGRGGAQRPCRRRPARPCQGIDDAGQLLRPEGRTDRRRRRLGRDRDHAEEVPQRWG